MILQALTQYYEDLLHRGEIAAPGWSPAKISFALCLDKDGQVTQIINIQQPSENGKAQMPQTIKNLPAPVKRTVGIASNFLWDNSTYLLGVDQKGKPKRSQTVLHTDAGTRQFFRFFFTHNCNRALVKNFPDKLVTIHPFSADCHKNIARFHFAGIDYDSCRFFAGIAADYSHSRRRTGSGMLSRRHSQMPVSYTHLTLPTIYSV